MAPPSKVRSQQHANKFGKRPLTKQAIVHEQVLMIMMLMLADDADASEFISQYI